MKTTSLSFLALSLLACACPKPKEPQPPTVSAKAAVTLLQQGQLDAAQQEAQKILALDKSNPEAHLVSAISRYTSLTKKIQTTINNQRQNPTFSDRKTTAENFTRELQPEITELHSIIGELEAASQSPDISLELCVSCWKQDWDNSGTIDASDTQLLQLEVDAEGHELTPDNPKRNPTFRFDQGDVFFALGLLQTQEALMQLSLSYNWFNPLFVYEPPTVGFSVQDALLLRQSKSSFSSAIKSFSSARSAYLAETDDDRELIPNPKQKNHPIYLNADTSLYSTWQTVLDDTTKLLDGTESLPVPFLQKLNPNWTTPPSKHLNISVLFDEPKDIAIDIMSDIDGPDAYLKNIFPNAYGAPTPASKLIEHAQPLVPLFFRVIKSYQSRD